MAVAALVLSPETDPPRPGPANAPPARKWVRRVAVGVILVPFVLVAVRLWLRRNDGYIPFADHALFEMQLRDLPRQLPLVGVYSRFGFNHPGPLEAYLVGAVYWLTGKHSLSMWIGGAAINAAACVAVVLIAFRRLGQVGGVLATGVLAVYLVYLGPLGMSDPWNPIISVLPFLAFVACCWDAWLGGRWVWLAVVATGSFVVQAHLGYAVPVVALIALVVGARAWGLRHWWRPAARRAWPVALGVLGLGALLWAPPLYQQLTGTPGNLGLLAEYATTSRPAQHTWRESAALASREVVSPLGNLFARPRVNVVMQWPQQMRILMMLGALVILGSLAMAVVRRRREPVTLFALGGLGWILAVVQSTRVERELWPYLTLWISTFFVVFGIAIIATWLPEVRRALARIPFRVRSGAGAAALVACALVLAAGATLAPWPSPDQRPEIGPIVAALQGKLPTEGAVLIDGNGRSAMFDLTTLDGALLREGVDVRAENALALEYGSRVIGDDTPVLTLYLVVIDPTQPPPEIPGRTLFASGGRLALYEPA